MRKTAEPISIPRQIAMSARIVLSTMMICCVLYTLIILGVGQLLVPYTANGSLIQNEHGEIVGSESIAQEFTRPEYFWPRPSAADYNASATGGSNWSPSNPALRERAETILARINAAGAKPVPADLVTASGSGMDPHITLNAAQYQAGRVASARGIPVEQITKRIEKHAKHTGGVLTPEPLVNVLLLNMSLDRRRQSYEQQPRR